MRPIPPSRRTARASPSNRSVTATSGTSTWSGRNLARSRRISTGGGNNQRAAWSPDGNYIAFESNRDGKTDIYIAAADGSREWRLTTNPGNNGWPAWSVDPNAPRPPTPAPASPTPFAAPATATPVVAAPPSGFAITSITAIANPQNMSGPCPQTFLFTAVVAATAPGAVAYQWESQRWHEVGGCSAHLPRRQPDPDRHLSGDLQPVRRVQHALARRRAGRRRLRTRRRLR